MADGTIKRKGSRVALTALALCCIGMFALGQISDVTSEITNDATEQTSKDDESMAGLDSPRSSLTSFLDSTAPDTKNEELAEAVLSPDGLSTNSAVRSRLVNSLNRVVRWLGWDKAKVNKFVPGSGYKIDTWQLFPFKHDDAHDLTSRSKRLEEVVGSGYMIVLEKGKDGSYRFAPESIDAKSLDALSSAVQKILRESGVRTYHSLSDWVSINAPESLLDKFVFLEIWQWIGLAVVLFIGLLVDVFMRIILSFVVRRICNHYNAAPDQKSIKHTIRAFGFLSAAIVWYLLLSILDLPIDAFTVIQPVSRIIFIAAITWCLWRLTDLIGDAFTSRANRTDTKLDDILVPMVRKTIKGLILVFFLLNLAPLFGLEVGPLLAAVGVGTVALGFAFKNTIENFFGSVTVVLDKPFQVGDWVVCKNIEGTVEAVGMRSTRIRTFYNSLVTMPNSLLITNEVDNYGLRKYRRWSSTLGLSMNTPPALVDAFCEAIREVIRQHPYTRKDYYQVWLNEFGNSTYDVMIYVFWEAPDWQTELRERHRFMLEILRVADAMDVKFAYPTQTIYLDRNPKPSEPAIKGLDTKSDTELRRDAREIVRNITKNDAWQEEKPPKYRFSSAEETAKVDAHSDADRRKQMEEDLQKREQANLPSESGDDPENPDFTEQRDAGG